MIRIPGGTSDVREWCAATSKCVRIINRKGSLTYLECIHLEKALFEMEAVFKRYFRDRTKGVKGKQVLHTSYK